MNDENLFLNNFLRDKLILFYMNVFLHTISFVSYCYKVQTKTPSRRHQITAQQLADEDVEDDDLSYDHSSAVATPSIGLAGGKAIRPRSPMVICVLDIIIWSYL